MKTVIKPQEGIETENGMIRFGMSKAEVMENPEIRASVTDNELRIDYDADGTVNFIEFSEGNLRPELYGISVFDSTAYKIIDILRKNGGEPIEIENGHTIIFPEISVGLYRERTPDAVKKDAEELKRMGISDEAYISEETEKANRLTTVGFGIKEYYKEIPNEETRKAIDNVNHGIGLSKAFHSVSELMENLSDEK